MCGRQRERDTHCSRFPADTGALYFWRCCFFTDAAVRGPFRTVKIDKLTRPRYRHFRLKEVGHFIDTPFALFIEWDGYVVEPRAWDRRFRDYDYIGAKWPEHFDGMRVGNGGFSLQSKKLMDALTDARFAANTTEYFDKLLCRAYRRTLERDFNIRFPRRSRLLTCFHTKTPCLFNRHSVFTAWPKYAPDAGCRGD